MSKLGSLYIQLGEPEGELAGCCETSEWAADHIESLRQQLELKHQECISFYNEAETVIKQRDDLRQQLTEKVLLNNQLSDLLGEAEQKLANSQKREVLLRDALSLAYTNEGGYHEWKETASSALAATDDLDGLILCEKEAVSFLHEESLDEYTIPLYRAWEPTK